MYELKLIVLTEISGIRAVLLIIQPHKENMLFYVQLKAQIWKQMLR